MKNRSRGLRLIILGGLLGAAGVTVAGNTAFGLDGSVQEQFGVAIRQILMQTSDGGAVALVNGAGITQRELDIETVTRQFSGKPVDRSAALQSLINLHVASAEAARRGITVSDKELGTFVTEQRSIADQDPDRHFYRYAAGLGQSEASIWSYTPLLDEWRRHMVVAKLKHSVRGEVTEKTVDAKEAEWATYVQGLRAQAEVVVK